MGTEQDETCPNCGHDNGEDFDVCECCGYGTLPAFSEELDND